MEHPQELVWLRVLQTVTLKNQKSLFLLRYREKYQKEKTLLPHLHQTQKQEASRSGEFVKTLL